MKNKTSISIYLICGAIVTVAMLIIKLAGFVLHKLVMTLLF